MDEFTRAYLTCALWAENLDAEYEIGEISAESLVEQTEICRQFQEANRADLDAASEIDGYSTEKAGHDFWLTRNRHGAGFWDRGLGKVGRKLTDAAHAWGEAYVDCDGLKWWVYE